MYGLKGKQRLLGETESINNCTSHQCKKNNYCFLTLYFAPKT